MGAIMGFENTHTTMSGSVSYGQVYPSKGKSVSVDATHLYVSLSKLIAETVCYHPSLMNKHDQNLSEQERQTLDAIVDDGEPSEHFISMLVSTIESQLKTQNYESVKLCLSDMDSYGYSALIGGFLEQEETNPFMGVRGVSRFSSEKYASDFALECEVVKSLQRHGFHVAIVVPFVRTLSDAATVIDRLAENGLPRGLNGLTVFYSCDVPSAILLSERLLQYFDGVTINVEHLTQFTLGIDRSNEQLAHLFKPDNEAVTMLIDHTVKSAHIAKKSASIVYDVLNDNSKFDHYLKEHCHADIVYYD